MSYDHTVNKGNSPDCSCDTRQLPEDIDELKILRKTLMETKKNINWKEINDIDSIIWGIEDDLDGVLKYNPYMPSKLTIELLNKGIEEIERNPGWPENEDEADDYIYVYMVLYNFKVDINRKIKALHLTLEL